MRRSFLILIVGVALLGSSCMRLDRTLIVERDGDLRLENVLDVEIDRAIPVMRDALLDVDWPDDPEGFLCERLGQTGQAFVMSDASVKNLNDDGFCGVRVIEEFDGTAELSPLVSWLLDTGSGGSTLVNNGDIWDFESWMASGPGAVIAIVRCGIRPR